MNEKPEVELTEGSQYKIFSLGGRDNMLETVGTFKGFTSLGVDEPGLLMELNGNMEKWLGRLELSLYMLYLQLIYLKQYPTRKRTMQKRWIIMLGSVIRRSFIRFSLISYIIY